MKFVVLSKLTNAGLTNAGAKTVNEKPHRIKEVNKELQDMGVKVLDQYALLGEYDFVNIVEADSNKTVTKAMLQEKYWPTCVEPSET